MSPRAPLRQGGAYARAPQVPDCLASIAMAKKGLGPGAVANAIGSQIINIFIGAPPWRSWRKERACAPDRLTPNGTVHADGGGRAGLALRDRGRQPARHRRRDAVSALPPGVHRDLRRPVRGSHVHPAALVARWHGSHGRRRSSFVADPHEALSLGLVWCARASDASRPCVVIRPGSRAGDTRCGAWVCAAAVWVACNLIIVQAAPDEAARTHPC